MGQNGLPAELISVVHNIQLNEAGWWEESIRRAILTVLWYHDSGVTQTDIENQLVSDFNLKRDNFDANSALKILESQDKVARIKGNKYKLKEETRSELDGVIEDFESLESEVEERFYEVLSNHQVSVEHGKVWNKFQNGLLIPLVHQMGAKVYEVLSTKETDFVPTKLVNDFLTGFEDIDRSILKSVVEKFLDPHSYIIKEYLLRHLIAYFTVEAGSLDEEALSSLRDNLSENIKFNVFVDTNFLFSILELHENPANDTAQSLLEISNRLSGEVEIDFYGPVAILA